MRKILSILGILILLLALAGLGWFLWARFGQPQPAATARPAPTPTKPPVLYFIPDVNANCRAGPSVEEALLAALEPGMPYRVFGVDLGATWLFINTGPVQCWVSATTGEVMGRITWVPLITGEAGRPATGEQGPGTSSESGGAPGGGGDGSVAGGSDSGSPSIVTPSAGTGSSGTRGGSGTIDLGISNAFFDPQGALWATVVNNGPGSFNATIDLQCTIWYQASPAELPLGIGGSQVHASLLEPGQMVDIKTPCALDPRQGAYYGASAIIITLSPDSNPDNDLFTLQP